MINKLKTLKSLLEAESSNHPEFKLYASLIDQEIKLFVSSGKTDALKGLMSFVLDRMLEKKEIRNDVGFLLDPMIEGV